MSRVYWPSNWVFILAAIGSAAGLGNLWRFPALAFEHGGGAFVVAIIVANLLIGIPLLALEVGLGQMMQKGAADAMKAIKKSFRIVGWMALVLGFMVISYYMAVVAWGVDYFGAAFTLGWGADTQAFFFRDILQISDSVSTLGGISWPVFAGLLVAWVLIFFSVWRGVKSVSKVVVWTATLPFFILMLLIVRAITLPGAEEGLRLFFLPEWSALLSTDLWLAAFSQVFFSLSLAFGVMIAYGSFKRREDEIVKSVVYVAIGNFLVSLMSGIVVFGTLGYMALQQGVGVTEVLAAGPGLVFVVFPQAINLLPAFNAVIAVFFYGMLLTLAIDSAFSLFEGVAASIRDRFPQVPQIKIVFALIVLMFFASLIYITKGGLYALDIVDHFVVDYGLVVVGILEAIIVGWLWKGNKLRQFINQHSEWKLGKLWDISIKFIIPVFLIVLLILNLVDEFRTPYEGYPTAALFYLGILPMLLVPVIAVLVDKFTTPKVGTEGVR